MTVNSASLDRWIFCGLQIVLLASCSAKSALQFVVPIDENSSSAKASTVPCADEANAKFVVAMETAVKQKIIADTGLTAERKALMIKNQDEKIKEAISNHEKQLKTCKLFD